MMKFEAAVYVSRLQFVFAKERWVSLLRFVLDQPSPAGAVSDLHKTWNITKSLGIRGIGVYGLPWQAKQCWR